MSWQRILQDEIGAGEALSQRVEALFEQQRATWPALREGEAALGQLRRKTLDCGADRIVVQLNAARRRSTHAKVDAQSLAARPCFLCPQHMPAEERGVEFENLVILPNPFPVLPRHCTIADREHRPQRLAGSVDMMLRLSAALGPEMAVLYNGPRCGASAPDHFHLQAASAAEIPFLSQLPAAKEGHQRLVKTSFGRTMLVLASSEPTALRMDIEQALETLGHLEDSPEEPMFNLLTHYSQGRYAAVLFPRAAHRPRCYYAEGDGRLGISPAVLEMAGVLVVTEPDEFERIDAEVAQAVYMEVSCNPSQLEKLGTFAVSTAQKYDR